jgi:cysteine desulfurase/selenocysteine lyase
MAKVLRHATELAETLTAELGVIQGLQLYPRDPSAERLPIVSFAVPGLAADDVAALLSNRYGIMVRSGVHCAEPLVRHFGEKGLARVSLHVYNTVDEVRFIGESLRKLCRFLG